MAVDATAAALSERLDALAAALRAAGVSPERSAGLLASAAEATMHAVMLEAMLEEQRAPAVEPDALEAEPTPLRVSLAA